MLTPMAKQRAIVNPSKTKKTKNKTFKNIDVQINMTFTENMEILTEMEQLR